MYNVSKLCAKFLHILWNLYSSGRSNNIVRLLWKHNNIPALHMALYGIDSSHCEAATQALTSTREGSCSSSFKYVHFIHCRNHRPLPNLIALGHLLCSFVLSHTFKDNVRTKVEACLTLNKNKLTIKTCSRYITAIRVVWCLLCKTISTNKGTELVSPIKKEIPSYKNDFHES